MPNYDNQQMFDALWRYPDKMLEQRPEKLLVYEERGGYVAQQKLDGYRCLVMGDKSQVSCLSRHRKPMAVSQEILDSFLELELPEPWMLDSEWVKLRTMTPETVYILDSLYMGGEWMGNLNLYERQEPYDIGTYPDGIFVPEQAIDDFVWFLADQITEGNPKEAVSEGVVIKRIESHLIGNRRKSDKNPGWAKIKWRAGEGGDTQILTVEQLEELAASNA